MLYIYKLIPMFKKILIHVIIVLDNTHICGLYTESIPLFSRLKNYSLLFS